MTTTKLTFSTWTGRNGETRTYVNGLVDLVDEHTPYTLSGAGVRRLAQVKVWIDGTREVHFDSEPKELRMRGTTPAELTPVILAQYDTRPVSVAPAPTAAARTAVLDPAGEALRIGRSYGVNGQIWDNA